MSCKVVIVEGEVSDEKIEQIKNAFSNGERGVIIVGTAANGEDRILFPTDITEEDVWQTQVDGKSIAEMIKMYHNLQSEKHLSALIDGIANIKIEPMPNLTLNGFSDSSNFLPNRYGGGSNPHKGGRNQRIRRR